MNNLIGQQWGNYKLTRLLGQGGFAEVYLGEHIRLRITSAVKILHTYLSEEGATAFQHEAQVIASLSHPHIVPVLDFDVQNGRPFLVLDYAPGGSLRQLHPRGSRVPLVRIAEYTQQVADALSYAHEQKLIHRDIKPENMLLGRMNEVLLSDFGIVAIAHSTSSMSTQASMGTLPYMAPEQIQGKPRTASDQYSLAVTIYQWLSGVLPFQGSSVEIIAQHLGVAAPSLRTHIPEISQEVDQVVLKALSKAPEERFATVQDFATTLEQAIMAPLRQSNLSPATLPASMHSSPLEIAVSPTEPNKPAQQNTPPTKFIAPPIKQNELTLQNTPAAKITTPPAEQNPPAHNTIVSQPVLIRPAAFQKNAIAQVSARAQQLIRSSSVVSRREVITGLAIAGISVGGAALLGYQSGSSAGSAALLAAQSSGPNSNKYDTKYSYGARASGLIWSPDGKYLAAIDPSRQQINVWTPFNWKPITTYPTVADELIDLAWSPDSQRIAAVNQKNVFIWNAANGKTLLTYQGHTNLNNLSWSSDGNYIATAELDGQLYIWSTTDGKISHSFPWSFGQHQYLVINMMSWSPNGKYIAVSSDASFPGHSLDIFLAANGKSISTPNLNGTRGENVWGAWSHDSIYIAGTGSLEPFIQIWQADNGNSMLIYRGHNSTINSFSWSPDDAYIVSASKETQKPAIHIWSTKTGEKVQVHYTPGGVNGIDWSPDGRYIAASNNFRVYIWQAP